MGVLPIVLVEAVIMIIMMPVTLISKFRLGVIGMFNSGLKFKLMYVIFYRYFQFKLTGGPVWHLGNLKILPGTAGSGTLKLEMGLQVGHRLPPPC